jgi:hypothetical protein
MHDQRDPAVRCVPYDLRVEGKDALDGRALADPGNPQDGKAVCMGMVSPYVIQPFAGNGGIVTGGELRCINL